jgi:uncharacterized membrane protein YjjP (DUF1212 family)
LRQTEKVAKRLEQMPVSEAGSESQIGDPEAVDFVLTLGRALHQYGSAAHRLEDVLDHVAKKLGLETQVFSQPTSIFASFGPQSSQRTFMIRVNPGEVNLGRLSDVDDVVRGVLHGGLSLREGSERLDRIPLTEVRYGTVANVLSFGVISAASALLLGGGIEELGIASVIGLIIGMLSLIAHKSKRFGRVFTSVAALVAAMLATLATQLVGAYSVPTATLAGIIALLPGFTLTVALAELSTQHLASGTARLSGAFVVFLELIFGVALGTAIVLAVLGTERLPVSRAHTLPAWVQLVPLVVMPLALTVRLRAHARDAVWILITGGLAIVGSRVGSYLLEPQIGVFLGALIVGIASNVFARTFNRPSVTTWVPGLLLLVPGSVGFRSFTSLLDNEVVIGVETAFKMILSAVALVAGTFMANVITPPRRL